MTYIYVNGEIVDQKDARISPYDHGFLYGLGLFETFRTYNGKPFLLDEHLERLNSSLQTLHIAKQFDREEVLILIDKLCEVNQLQDSYIRFNVSAGTGDIGLQTSPYEEPTVIVFQKSLPTSNRFTEKEGVFLNLRRNTPETDVRLKSHHYLNNIAAKREIGNNPLKEGIFLSAGSNVAEGVVSNVFWVKDEIIYTPAIETGILPGITREFVMKLARKNGFLVEEGLYKKSELLAADEAFFTNSIQEIIPIMKIDKREYPGQKGKITQLLYKYYVEAIV